MQIGSHPPEQRHHNLWSSLLYQMFVLLLEKISVTMIRIIYLHLTSFLQVIIYLGKYCKNVWIDG